MDDNNLVITSEEFEQIIANSTEVDRNRLIGADLTQVHFKTPAYLNQLKLSGAILDKVELDRAKILGCDFSRASLQQTNLAGTTLGGVNFTHANLTEANLHGAKINRVKFTNANLSKANLELLDFEDFISQDRQSDKSMFDRTNFEGAIL